MIPLFMDYCMSRQLRPKTMLSYEQANRLFALWLEESEGVKQVEEVKDMHIRPYIIVLQTRGKYTFTSNIRSRDINHPDRRTDYGHKITNITINNYLRNIRVFSRGWWILNASRNLRWRKSASCPNSAAPRNT